VPTHPWPSRATWTWWCCRRSSTDWLAAHPDLIVSLKSHAQALLDGFEGGATDHQGKITALGLY